MLSACYRSADQYAQLMQRHAELDAKITAVYCNRPVEIRYSFQIKDKKFEERVPSGALVCKDVRVGDTLKIYYDPQLPEVNTPLHPSVAYQREHGFYFPEWLYIMLFLPLYLLSQYLQAKREK